MADPASGRRRAASLLAMAGAVVVTVATILPWATTLTAVSRATRTGWVAPSGEVRWGVPLSLVAVVTVVCQLVLLVGVRRERVGFGIALGAAIAAAGMAALSMFALADAGRVRVDGAVELGVGPFLGVSGALVAVVGSALVVVAHPAARVTAPRAVGAVG